MEKLICPNCEATEDVIEVMDYVGGKGLIPIVQCRDKVTYWKRWDTQLQFSLNHMGGSGGQFTGEHSEGNSMREEGLNLSDPRSKMGCLAHTINSRLQIANFGYLILDLGLPKLEE